MEILLIRHGESRGNAFPEEYLEKPDCEINLTENGEDQSYYLGGYFSDLYGGNKVHVICSPFLRAKRTAQMSMIDFDLYNKSGEGFHTPTYTYEESPLLVERNWGGLRDKVFNKEHKSEDFKFFNKPIGGESFFDLYQRVFMFRESLKQKKYSDKEVVFIFTHGEWMKVFKMIQEEIDVETFDREAKDWEIRNCQTLSYKLDI